MSILHRKIFFELARIFLLSLFGITGILVMAGLVAEATQQGLGPAQILVAIPLLVPNTLPYTIPTTTLFATCLVYGRLAHDNEILAIKSAGVHVLYVVWPGVLLGLIMSAVTMIMYVDLIPTTFHILRSQVLNDMEEYMYALLRRDNYIKQPGLNYVIFVRKVHGKRLEDALFKRQDAQTGQYDVIAAAREAFLHVATVREKGEMRKVLNVTMHHGQLLDNGQGRDPAHRRPNLGVFEDQTWTVDLPQEASKLNKKGRPRAMTWWELLQRRQELADEIKETAAQQALAMTQSALSQPPATLPEHLRNLRFELDRRRLDRRCVEAEMYMRTALSCGCLFFVLVGCPVGIWFSRSDYLSAFISCFLPIVFVYYPLLLCSNNLAKDGKLPAIVALWMANGALALIAPYLFWNLSKN